MRRPVNLINYFTTHFFHDIYIIWFIVLFNQNLAIKESTVARKFRSFEKINPKVKIDEMTFRNDINVLNYKMFCRSLIRIMI